MSESEEAEYEPVMPYWIDTDAYTDRDREMFVCGAEFTMLYRLLENGWRGCRPIHRENESRVRMMAGRLGIPCTVTAQEGYGETWSHADFVETPEDIETTD